METQEDIGICLKQDVLWEEGGKLSFTERQELSHRLLRLSAAAWLKERGQEEETQDWTLAGGRYGKPFFAEHPHIHFSISHSGSVWCCAFGSSPVGLDVQAHRLKGGRQRIADRFFHPAERDWIRKGGDFFAVWAAKESYVKYTGEGMRRAFSDFAVADENGMLSCVRTADSDAQLRLLPAPGAYSLCLCAKRIGKVTFFHI